METETSKDKRRLPPDRWAAIFPLTADCYLPPDCGLLSADCYLPPDCWAATFLLTADFYLSPDCRLLPSP